MYKSIWQRGNLCKQSQQSSQCFLFKKTTILTNERKWIAIDANPSHGGGLSIQVSKLVTRMVRHYDHWGTVRSVLLKAFGKQGAHKFSERYWIQLIQEGSSQKRVEYCVDHTKTLVLPLSNSRTHWWYSDNARTDGIHVYSLQLERVHLSQRLFVERSIYLGEWIDSGWKRLRQKHVRQSSSHI